ERPVHWFCDDRNVVAPVSASQSLLTSEQRLDKNVQATRSVLFTGSATTGMSSHPFQRRKASSPASNAWTRMSKPRGA
ncbi:MAG: hypothetical protein ACK4P5_00845, partial [Fimbriimonadales bacterium]